MNRGTYLLMTEEDKDLARDILQHLAKKNLTIKKAKTILELAQIMINDARFSMLPPRSGDSDKNNLIQCPSCFSLCIPDGNSCENCGEEINLKSVAKFPQS